MDELDLVEARVLFSDEIEKISITRLDSTRRFIDNKIEWNKVLLKKYYMI